MAVDFRLVGGNKILSLGDVPGFPSYGTIPTSTQVLTETSTWTSLSPTAATRSNMGVASGITGRNGAVLGPNGLIYVAPAGGGTDLLIIDPAAGTARLSALGADFTGLDSTRGWYGGVLAADGRIFFAPYNAADVLIVDTTDTNSDPAGAASRSSYGLADFDNPVDSKWYGGVLGSDGKVYFVPSTATDVLVIDPATNTAVRTNFGVDLSGTAKYAGGVLGKDGKVYCIPANSTTILIIDPATSTAVKTTLGATLAAGAKWRGGVLGKDGRIYGIPSNVTDFLVIDTDTQAASVVTMGGDAVPLVSNGWWTGALGADGRIYATPRNHNQAIILDTDTQTVTMSALGADLASPSTNRWGGGALAADGAIYCPPFSATDILRIDTNGSGADNLDVLLSPTLNKY